MADSKLKHNLLENSEKQGGLTMNRILKNEFMNILSKDPTLDLSSWLKEKEVLYSTNRAKAIDFSLRKAAAKNEESGEASKALKRSILTKEVHSIQSLEVTRPLDASVLTWAEGAGLRSFPQQVMNNELNDIIAEYDVIDAQPSSLIVGLTPLIALKVGSRSSIRYLETFEYIVKHAPNIPVATLLGVLTTDGLAYTFMQRVHGVSLDKLWSSLGPAEKGGIQQQLIEPFKLLRAIPRPSGDFAFGTGCPPCCIDLRRHVRESTERITTESDFNRFLTKVDSSRSSHC